MDPPLKKVEFHQKVAEITLVKMPIVFVPIQILVIFLIWLFGFGTRFSLGFRSISKTLRILLVRRWINTAFGGIFSPKQKVVGL